MRRQPRGDREHTDDAHAVVPVVRHAVLVGARHGSPLILGIGDEDHPGEFFLASDAAAIVEYTRQVVYLEEGDICTITRGKGYEISSLHSSRASYDSAMFDALMKLAEEKGDGPELRHKSAERKTDTLELSLASIEKSGHKHFMLKEVCVPKRRNDVAGLRKKKDSVTVCGHVVCHLDGPVGSAGQK